MSFDFKVAQDVIKKTLGDNYASVQSKLDKVFEIAISQKSDLSSVTTESMKRKGDIVELNLQHNKALSESLDKFSDYDDIKSQLEEKTSQLEATNTKLSSFHEQRRDVLKKMSADFDFEKDENLKPISSRFKGLDKIETLENDQVEKFIGDFELLTLNKIPSGYGVPNPKKEPAKKEKQASRYAYKDNN